MTHPESFVDKAPRQSPITIGSRKGSNFKAVHSYPLALISADHSRAEEIEQSGHCYILKPFRLAELLELIEATLKASKASCEHKPV
jgi:hypothetical protein